MEEKLPRRRTSVDSLIQNYEIDAETVQLLRQNGKVPDTPRETVKLQIEPDILPSSA